MRQSPFRIAGARPKGRSEDRNTRLQAARVEIFDEQRRAIGNADAIGLEEGPNRPFPNGNLGLTRDQRKLGPDSPHRVDLRVDSMDHRQRRSPILVCARAATGASALAPVMIAGAAGTKRPPVRVKPCCRAWTCWPSRLLKVLIERVTTS